MEHGDPERFPNCPQFLAQVAYGKLPQELLSGWGGGRWGMLIVDGCEQVGSGSFLGV